MKKVIALMIAAVMTVSGPGAAVSAQASEIQKLENQENAANRQVSSLQNKQSKAQSEVDSLQAQLVDLMAQIDALEQDIKANSRDIKETKAEVKAAKKAEKKQYNAMKSRIRYFYENDTENNVFNILIGSKSLTDFINKVSYMNSVYSYDRELLDSYEATRIEIQGMEEDLENKQISLKTEKKQLKSSQSSLNSLIDSKKGEVADIEQQVATAKKAAQKLAAQKAEAIEKERQAKIAAAAAAAAKKAAEEEAKRKAAAAQKAAEEAAARQAEEAARKAASESVSTGDDSSGGSSSSNSGSSDSADTVTVDPTPVTNVSGSSVVSYANQFVGNSYVWGGNSLTNGCDCSGFVVQVYKHFGIDLSASRNSASLRYVGRAVSPDSLQAGDIVCYPGHVAIYEGNGCIVEAQSTRAGITNNRTWNHGTVLAIRRVI